MTKVAEFWSCDRDGERGTCLTIGDAVDEYVDTQLSEGQPIAETVTVYGFAQMTLPPHHKLVRWLEEMISEGLDEEYSNPDDPNSGFADCHRSHQKLEELAHVLKREYPVHWCEPVCEHTIRVRDYVDIETAI